MEKSLLEMFYALSKGFKRFKVFEVPNMMAHKGVGVPGKAESVLQFPAAGEDVLHREGEPYREGDISP